MKLLLISFLLLASGCTTMGRTTTKEESLTCFGFCFKQEFDSQVEIVKQ